MNRVPPSFADWTPEQVALAKHWVRTWQKAAPVLERLRREELRREAELQQEAGDENVPPDYQQAIQSMIGRNRANNRSGARDEQ